MRHSSWAKRVPLVPPVLVLVLLAMACSFPLSNPSASASLAAPGTLQVTPSTVYIGLSWSPVSGAESYRVYRSSDGGPYSLVAQGVTALAWKDSGVTSGVSYSYKVRAYRVAGGEGAPSAAVSARTADGAEAEKLVAAGKAYLSQRPPDYTRALTAFSRSLQSDPTNYTALLWTCLLTLAQTITTSSVQTLATTYLGFENYPTSMDAFFQPGPHGVPAWMGQAVDAGAMHFVYVGPNNGDWVSTGPNSYMSVEPGTGDYAFESYLSYVPQVRIPATIQAWAGNPAVVTPGEYSMAVLYNLATHNPNGFNSLADHVVNGILSTALDQVVNTLEASSLPDDAQIDITSDMFGGAFSSGWPLDVSSQPATISIGKAELLGLTGFLQMMKADLLMAKTVSLDFPVQQYFNTLNPVDNPELNTTSLILAALYTLPNPIQGGFLCARPDAATTLAAAKTAYVAALSSVDQAVTMILDRGEGSPFTISEFSSIPDISANWQTASDVLNYSHIAITKMSDSVQNGHVMVIPTNFGSFPGPMEFIQYYATESNWPATPDDGPYSGPPQSIGVNLAPAFVTPLAALDSLLDLRSNGEPNWYPFSLTFSAGTQQGGSPVLIDSAITDSDYAPLSGIGAPEVVAALSQGTSIGAIAANLGAYHFYAIRLKDVTLGGTLAIDDTALGNLKDVIAAATSGLLSKTALDGLLVRNPTTGAITAYLPAFPAFVADNSFVAAGTAIAVDGNGDLAPDISYTTTGSFWWAVADMMQNANGPYVLGVDFAPVLPQ